MAEAHKNRNPQENVMVDEREFVFRFRLFCLDRDVNTSEAGKVHAMVASMLRSILEVVVLCNENGKSIDVTHFHYQNSQSLVYPIFPGVERRKTLPGLVGAETFHINDDQVVWIEHEDKVMVMRVDDLKIVSLNKQGAFIWKLIERKLAMDEITASLCERYHVDQERAMRDVQGFLHMLMESGLISVNDPSVNYRTKFGTSLS